MNQGILLRATAECKVKRRCDMHRFKSILLVFNPKVGNEAALTRAVSLAKNNKHS